MKQFGKIFNFELKYYLKNKIFVGVTLFLVLLIAVVMFFPTIKAVIIPEKQANDKENKGVMLIRVEDENIKNAVVECFIGAFSDYEVEETVLNIKQIEERVKDSRAECAFVLKSPTSYNYYVNNLSIYDMNTTVADEALQKLYQTNALLASGMTPDEAMAVMTVKIDGETKNLGADQAENYWYTYIMIFALYMVILLYGQMVATNVATEKSSRAMEVLITSAKPVSMMFGKVLASCVAGFIQLVSVFGSAILFYSINKKHWGDNQIITAIFDMPASLFAYMLIFFVLGFLIYAFMFGAVGSTASKLEDINTSVMPITMLFVVAFIIVVMAFTTGEVDTPIMIACSYIPFTSSMAMFTRIAMSVVPWYEIAISIGVLIGSVVGVGIISAKIYRVGVLLYGTTPKITSIIKSVFKG